ncbi:MAG TPA: TetR family transcriptional regulator [Pseudonocardiaceae bacterium]|jgi:AcrR family transcriptional regulator|nr:TetR family transcriptional regulator [Pseudonocardiaceae bacterium]
MTEETPRERRERHRTERRQVLTAPEEERLDQARRLLDEQREERRAARGRGRSRRAPAMGVDERRAAILEVAVPMLVEHGGAVKTSEIAAAAGIAEGTLFRAFRDKPALLRACLRATLESETEIGRIESIDPSLPLENRLTEAVGAVADFQNRLWSVAVALRSAGVDPRDEGDEGHEHDGPPKAMIGISAAIARLFDAERLRIAPDLAARLLLGFVFSNRMRAEGMGESGAELGELVDVFLHGALKGEN